MQAEGATSFLPQSDRRVDSRRRLAGREHAAAAKPTAGPGPGTPPPPERPPTALHGSAIDHPFRNPIPAKLTTLWSSIFHCSYFNSSPRAFGAVFKNRSEERRVGK